MRIESRALSLTPVILEFARLSRVEADISNQVISQPAWDRVRPSFKKTKKEEKERRVRNGEIKSV